MFGSLEDLLYPSLPDVGRMGLSGSLIVYKIKLLIKSKKALTSSPYTAHGYH